MRGYLRTGDCPGGAEPVVKVVGGLGGDEIEVEAGWVAVNGERLTNSATDGAGQRGPLAQACGVGETPGGQG